MATFYVYTLARPDGSVFYVGKGSGNRFALHELAARTGKTKSPCVDVIRDIWAAGGQVERAIVFESDDEHECYTQEREWIARYSGLVNRAKGGNGRMALSSVAPVRPSPPDVGVLFNVFALKKQVELRLGQDISWNRVASETGLHCATVTGIAYNQSLRADVATLTRLLRWFREQGLEVAPGDLWTEGPPATD